MTPLTDMKAGEKGTVVQILGGYSAHRRLELLGVRVGKKIGKVSSALMRGPVVVKIDKSRVAIGHGIASNIIVEMDGKK